MVSRRDFLVKGTLLSTTGALVKANSSFDIVSGASKLMKHRMQSSSYSPMKNLKDFKGTPVIGGDMHDEAHEIFWDKRGFIKKKGGLPKPSATYDVVIVGGGLSGLASAYSLRDKNVLMLEGHTRLGGNARVEKYRDTYMSQGSAYVTIPEKGSRVDAYFKDIGVDKIFKKVPNGEHPVLFKNELVKSFWHGSTDKLNRDEFHRVHKRLMEIYENEYPDLPLYPNMKINRNALNELDSLTIEDWVRKELGSIHPHIEEYFHQYCWSSFCSSYSEVSAAQFLNFFTSDMAGIQSLPGGNGLIAVNTLKKMKNSRFSVESGSFVVDIREDGDGVYVCYHENGKVLKAVRAKKCIVTSPKLVAKKIIHQLKKSQYEAMDEMTYHAYLVANVLFKNHLEPKYYDIYSLKGKVPESEYKASKERVFCDITSAHWANSDVAQRSAVTLYLPIPYAMGQQYLFSPSLYDKYSRRIKRALEPFLKQSNKSWADVEGIRMARYGHSMAVAKAGAISSGQLEKAHAPINNKIFFANQDNWANPCFETSFAVGTLAAYQATGKTLV